MRLPVFSLLLCGALNISFAQQSSPGSPAERQLESQGISARDLAPYPEVRAALLRNDYAAALEALARIEAEHENDPTYYDLRGLIALQSGRFADAASAFERVVLMQPDNAGAWLDLAVASMEAGNLAAATSYLDHIEATFTPPPTLRALITRFRTRIATPVPRPTSGLRLQAEVLVGIDNNANSGLNVSSIPVTSGGDRIDLPLDETYKARRDSYGQASLNASYKMPTRLGQLEVTGGARQRSFRKEKDYSTLDLNGGLGLVTNTPLGDASFWLQGSDLSLGNKQLMRIGRTMALLDSPLGACRTSAGIESEWRRYATLTNLNADLTWLMLGLGCEARLATLPMQWTMLIRGGLDDPTGDRAGGKSHTVELVSQFTFALPWGIYADLSHVVGRTRDEEGYSPLLENNAAREVTRRRTRLSFNFPITAGLDAVLNLEDSRVSSNLSLFRQSGQAISLGLRKQF